MLTTEKLNSTVGLTCGLLAALIQAAVFISPFKDATVPRDRLAVVRTTKATAAPA